MSRSSTKVIDSASQVIAQVSGSSRKIVEAFARMTESETKKLLLRGSRSGRTYTVPKTGVEYTASAPGEAPAPRTGSLASSYNHQVVSDTESIVYSQLKYAKIEFGWGDIRPRPHLRPASAKVMKDKDRIISKFTRGMK